MKKLIISLLISLAPVCLLGQYTVGEGGDFVSLEEAFSIINNSGIDVGDITLEIVSDLIESNTVILYESGKDGMSFYSSVTVYTSTPGLSITGNMSGPLIELNNAANLIIDGRVNGVADLIINNTSTSASASTIYFTNSANHNTIKYCQLRGSTTGAGIIHFGTSSEGSGNSNNIIDHNLISNSGNRPLNVLLSQGTQGSENSSNEITGNEFFDFFMAGTSSFGINLGANTTNWIISGNSFYETSSFVPASVASYTVININNSGTGFQITGNYIGGQSAACSGSPWTKTNAFVNSFTGINISAGTSAASEINNNRISNFSWNNSASSGTASWTGIQANAGLINVGTTTANIIGASSGTGSVLITGGTALTSFYGITIAGTAQVNCENNIIGSVTAANSTTTASTNLYGINRTSSGTTLVSGNTIGNETTANSLNASGISSNSSQIVIGINNTGSGDLTIRGNLIANINNANTRLKGLASTGKVQGITSTSSSGINTISDNIIHDLSIATGNTNSAINTSACGIALGSTAQRVVTGNTIYNLVNSNPSYDGTLIGILFSGGTSGNRISENFIYDLSVTGATSTSASLIGIKTSVGIVTIANNIIALSIDKSANLYGIYDTGGSANNINAYFNSVYIGGTVGSGLSKSYAFYSHANTNARDIRNNIFSNNRITDNGTNLHSAIYFNASGGTITSDYNDFFVSAADQGGITGYYNSQYITSLPVVPGNDANSYTVDPHFALAGSTAAEDYAIGTDLIGVAGTGVSTDFGKISRVNPTMGAWERAQNLWTGASSTAWNLPANWSANVVPLENSSITFAASPVKNLNLDADHTVRNINNGSSFRVVTNGHQLTIKGTTQGLIDATSSSSAVSYSGTTAQTISSAGFVSGKAYNIIINNAAGVTLNSSFTVDNNLTINTGSLTISAPYLLTVTGTLTNNTGNSGLVLKSTGNGVDAKLINNSASVPATVELSLSGGTGLYGPTYHYIIPAVQSFNIDNSSIAATASSLGLTNFGGDLMLYDEAKAVTAKNAGWQYFDGYNNTTGFNQLVSSRGYNIHLTAPDRITLTGNLNAAQHTFNLGYTGTNADPGWNLVGNPYPSNYDLTSVAELVNTDDDVDNTIYFNYEGGYGTYNVETGLGTLNGASSTLYSNIMSPMQGFYVRARSLNRSITLPVSGKTQALANPARSKKSGGETGGSEFSLIRLTLADGQVKDETVVALYEKATGDFDSDYDAYKLFETDAPYRSAKSATGFNIPSIYSEMNGVRYAVNFLPEPGEGSLRIPLAVKIKRAGSYTIEASEFENLNGTRVLLKHGSKETILGPGTIYSFRTDTGTYRNFELVIGYSEEINENTIGGNENIEAWYNDNQVFIRSPQEMTEGIKRLIIYDLQGRPVFEKPDTYLTPENIVSIPVNLRMGIYLIRINDIPKPFVTRVVITE